MAADDFGDLPVKSDTRQVVVSSHYAAHSETGEMAGNQCNVIQSGHLLVKTTCTLCTCGKNEAAHCGQATLDSAFLGSRTDLASTLMQHTMALQRLADRSDRSNRTSL